MIGSAPNYLGYMNYYFYFAIEQRRETMTFINSVDSEFRNWLYASDHIDTRLRTAVNFIKLESLLKNVLQYFYKKSFFMI